MEKTEGLKTVIVIDKVGKVYESTYPKRARGLVKSGRARYVDEHTICLTCPPSMKNLEENKMNNIINNEVKNSQTIDLPYIMAKIDEIVECNKKALASLGDLSEYNSPVPHPVSYVMECNNKLIGFLEKIYASLLPNAGLKKEVVYQISKSIMVAIEEENNDIAQMLIEKLTGFLE